MRTAHPDEIQQRPFWRKVRAAAGRFPFTVEVVAGYHAMRDHRTPWRHKAILAGAVAYFILPLDAIPDFIMPVGYSDDAAAVTAAMAAVAMSIREEHRVRAQRALGLVVPGSAQEGVVPGEVVDAG
jgi:uncharacterized membrane protein YkvA (DUF1232 family)